jgi:hypothetical protein
MFAPFLERLSARDEICMEKMQPQLVMETCAEALVRWSLMMTAEENKGISDEELMHKGQAALHIDMDELDRRATREYRERGEKAERRSLAAAATAGTAAGRGRGCSGGSGAGGGRGPVLPSASGWRSAGGAGRNGVMYCILCCVFPLARSCWKNNHERDEEEEKIIIQEKEEKNQKKKLKNLEIEQPNYQKEDARERRPNFKYA